MGNCFSDEAGGKAAVGGTSSATGGGAAAANDAIDYYLKSRGFHGIFSQIEVVTSSCVSRSLLEIFLWFR